MMHISKEEIEELIELKNNAALLVDEYREFKNNNKELDENDVQLRKRLIKIGQHANRIKYLESLDKEGE